MSKSEFAIITRIIKLVGMILCGTTKKINAEALILMSGSHIKYKYWEIYEALLMGEIHNEILQFTM